MIKNQDKNCKRDREFVKGTVNNDSTQYNMDNGDMKKG